MAIGAVEQANAALVAGGTALASGSVPVIIDAGPKLLAAFDHLLKAQRRDRPLPTLKPTSSSCRVTYATPRSQLMIGAKLRLHDGVLCSRTPDGWQRWALTKRQLRFINADFTTVDRAALPSCRSKAPQRRIVGRNVWGDRTILTTRCGAYVLPEPPGSLAALSPGVRV